jgi:hypothetical protein
MVYMGMGQGLQGWKGIGQSQGMRRENGALSRIVGKSHFWAQEGRFRPERKGEKVALPRDQKRVYG